MPEKDHYAGLIEGANREGWALWRLCDAPYLPPRPADICGGDPTGRLVLLEVKEVEAYRGVGSLKFEEAQVRWLRACGRRGGLALVAVYETTKRRMLLVRVAGQGDDLGPGWPGGLVGVRSAELKREMGRWTGWKAALEAWNDRGGPMEYGR